MKLKKKLLKKHKNTKGSTFIVSQRIIMKLHNAFNLMNRRSKPEFFKRKVLMQEICNQL